MIPDLIERPFLRQENNPFDASLIPPRHAMGLKRNWVMEKPSSKISLCASSHNGYHGHGETWHGGGVEKLAKKQVFSKTGFHSDSTGDGIYFNH
ncbi:MAG TPA: hypothetical protein DCS88_03555 [Alphaproteobacteria bacterium]|nr:hypothetical protein [Alphaproteobacteria bacterium]